jgi:hypothetical protein
MFEGYPAELPVFSRAQILDDAEPVHVDKIDMRVERDRVLRYLGHPRGERPDPQFARALDTWIPAASREATPQAVLVIARAIGAAEGNLRLDHQRTTVDFRGLEAPPLSGAQGVAAFLATAGSGIEALSRELLAKRQMLAGAIVDAVGAERAEAAASAALRTLRRRAEPEGLSVSVPCFPGQCGFDLQHQPQLFALFDGQTVGITLTPECLMRPLKSISGLVAIGPPTDIISDGSPCDQCDRTDCAHRMFVSDQRERR